MAKSNKNKCSLVLVEWEDSAQPTAAWMYLHDLPELSVVKCASVGWLIKDGDVKALAPNMGAIEDKEQIQASGIIRIPSRAVTKIVRLREKKKGPASES